MPRPRTNNVVKHNKKKNIGLIFELLTSHFTSALLEANDSKNTETIKILKKHYGNPRSPIYKENKYYDAIITTKCNSEVNARKIVESISAHYNRDHEHKLEKSRQLLIKQINENLGKDFWTQPIERDTYKAYASAYKVLKYANDNKLSLEETIDVTKSKSFLVEYLTSQGDREEKARKTLIEIMSPNNDNDDDVVQELLAVKYYQLFNKEYGNAINESQKKILNNFYFYLNSKNSSKFEQRLNEHRSELKIKLAKCRANRVAFINDEKLQEQLYASIDRYDKDVLFEQLDETKYEDIVTKILMYEELVKEVKDNT